MLYLLLVPAGEQATCYRAVLVLSGVAVRELLRGCTAPTSSQLIVLFAAHLLEKYT